MALFKVKIQQTTTQEGVVEAASAEEIKREAETKFKEEEMVDPISKRPPLLN